MASTDSHWPHVILWAPAACEKEWLEDCRKHRYVSWSPVWLYFLKMIAMISPTPYLLIMWSWQPPVSDGLHVPQLLERGWIFLWLASAESMPKMMPIISWKCYMFLSCSLGTLASEFSQRMLGGGKKADLDTDVRPTPSKVLAGAVPTRDTWVRHLQMVLVSSDCLPLPTAVSL